MYRIGNKRRTIQCRSSLVWENAKETNKEKQGDNCIYRSTQPYPLCWRTYVDWSPCYESKSTAKVPSELTLHPYGMRFWLNRKRSPLNEPHAVNRSLRTSKPSLKYIVLRPFIPSDPTVLIPFLDNRCSQTYLRTFHPLLVIICSIKSVRRFKT